MTTTRHRDPSPPPGPLPPRRVSPQRAAPTPRINPRPTGHSPSPSRARLAASAAGVDAPRPDSTAPRRRSSHHRPTPISRRPHQRRSAIASPPVARLRVDPYAPRVWRRSPWFAAIAPVLARFDAHESWPEVHEYATPGLPVRFVLQERSAAASAYDARITLDREVPTRPRCWHDFFNAMVWCAFPRAKAALHRRQHACAAADRPPGGRTRAQDRLTMLDEGGLLLLAPAAEHPALLAALAALEPIHRLPAAPGLPPHRALAFGHALHEHLVLGAAPVRAAALLIDDAALDPHVPLDMSLDTWLEARLDRADDLADEPRVGYPLFPPAG